MDHRVFHTSNKYYYPNMDHKASDLVNVTSTEIYSLETLSIIAINTDIIPY